MPTTSTTPSSPSDPRSMHGRSSWLRYPAALSLCRRQITVGGVQSCRTACFLAEGHRWLESKFYPPPSSLAHMQAALLRSFHRCFLRSFFRSSEALWVYEWCGWGGTQTMWSTTFYYDPLPSSLLAPVKIEIASKLFDCFWYGDRHTTWRGWWRTRPGRRPESGRRRRWRPPSEQPAPSAPTPPPPAPWSAACRGPSFHSPPPQMPSGWRRGQSPGSRRCWCRCWPLTRANIPLSPDPKPQLAPSSALPLCLDLPAPPHVISCREGFQCAIIS